MSSFFEKLARRYGVARQQIPAILQTHPVTADRIADARDRARQLQQHRPVDSMGYGTAKARLTVLQASTNAAARATFQARLDGDSTNPADRYGLALSFSQAGLYDEAERAFRDLMRRYPGTIAYRIGLGETLMQSGLTDAALAAYVEAIDLFPRNVPLTISYGEALIAAGQAAKAHAVLLDLLNNVPPTPEQIRLIARAANAAGDAGNAYYYMGEYYLSIGNPVLALGQLRMALEAPGVNSVDRARFQARSKQISEHLPEERRRQRNPDDPQRSPPLRSRQAAGSSAGS
jgi:predicted Zn-dependent protease